MILYEVSAPNCPKVEYEFWTEGSLLWDKYKPPLALGRFATGTNCVVPSENPVFTNVSALKNNKINSNLKFIFSV
jgi:hypothetical protein